MTLNTAGRPEARPLDIFKTIVAVILAIIALILLLQGGASYGMPTTGTNIVVDLPQIDKSGAFTISGLAAPGARLQLVANGISLGEVTAGADGRWQLAGDFAGSLKDSLKAGTYDLVARRTDAGGAGTQSPQIKLIVPDLSASASAMAAAATTAPALQPTTLSTEAPSAAPTEAPTAAPTQAPTTAPTAMPTEAPAAEPTAQPVAAATEAPTAAPATASTAAQGERQARVMVTGGLNVRESASTEAKQVGTLRMNTLVTVLEGPTRAGGYDWYRLDNGADVVGWVAAGPQNDPWLQLEVPALAPLAAAAAAPIAAATAAPTPAPTAGSAGEQEYIVQKGDSLYGLAQRFYGSGERWRQIFEATNARAATDSTFQVIARPQMIRPGQKLIIPAP